MRDMFTEIKRPTTEEGVVKALAALVKMLQDEEIGFEWFSNDAQALLEIVGWQE